MLNNSIDEYGSVARLFHWLTVVVVIGLFALGLWMVDLTYYSQWYKVAPDVHRSIGILLLMLIVFRLIWRFINIQPQSLDTHKAWEQKLAHWMHWVLYLCLCSMFISGYLISTSKGQAVDVFNWFSVPAITSGDALGIENMEDIAGEIHEILAYILITLASLHALAALKHHFFDKDRTLLRMLASNKKSPKREVQ